MNQPIDPSCPSCGADIRHHGVLESYGWVPDASQPGTIRADLLLECNACDAQFNAFVELSKFEPIAKEGANG